MRASGPAASRAGSHAGRGFRYQDAVGVWLAARCWAGELPYGEVVPEGWDDYELRAGVLTAFVQAKSRRNHLGPFPIGDVAHFVRALWGRCEASSSAVGDLILVLEGPVSEGPTVDHALADHQSLTQALRIDPRWATFAPRTQIWISPAPLEEAVATISGAASCRPLAAQVHYSELLHRIGTLADANGIVKNGRYSGLAVTDIEASVRRMEPLLDLAGVEAALRDGYCDTIDFLTPVNDPAFYQGVDTRPGHLAAGLLAERPEARCAVLDGLETHGAALVVGPSGAGKSALMWEAARAARHTIRWFEVRRGNAADAHLLVRLSRALRASPVAPIGFVLDDVGGGLGSLWDGLIREAGAGTGIVLLGSIREEDVFLLPSRAPAREVRPAVDETVAERIWRQLYDQGQTSWAGWCEPWRRSDGLLLEYVHILTRGERLKLVLREQIDRRLREARDTELAVLRVTALAGAAGAMIDAQRLTSVLGVAEDDLARALRRLIDEHLIAEPVAGRLGGLHQLRSTTLLDLCHAHPPSLMSRTVVEAVQSAASASLEGLASHVALHHPSESRALLEVLAVRLEQDRDPVAAAAALSGLGLAHIETTLRRWVPEALSLGLEPTQITLAVKFAVANTDLSSLPFPEHLRGAVRILRTRSASDPRLNLLSMLSSDSIRALITTADTTRLRTLLGTLVEMDCPESVRSALGAIEPDLDNIDLAGVSDLLGTTRLIDPKVAMAWTDNGVRERLLARVPVEMPWAGPVEVEDSPEGRLLRGSIFHVAPSTQADVHQEVVKLCDRLLGLDPTAMIAAVDAIAADGLPSGLPEYPLATKRIPRENLPPSALPEWNRRWTAAAAGLVGTESYTEYLRRSRSLLEQLVPALERIVDCVLRGKQPPPRVLERFGEVHKSSRALTAPRGESPIDGTAETHVAPLQNLLFSCSADLIRRFAQLPDGYGAFVLWAGDLLRDSNEVRSQLWDLVGGPPEQLFQQLENIVAALRLLAAEAGVQSARPTQLWMSETRKAARGNALRRARMAAERRLQTRSADYLRLVQAELVDAGVELELYARPNWDDPLPWPTLELLGLVGLESSADWMMWTLAHGPQVRAAVGEGRRIWIVPRIRELAVSRLTIGGLSSLFTSPYAVDDWLDTLHLLRLDDALSRAAQPALDLIVELEGCATSVSAWKAVPPSNAWCGRTMSANSPKIS